MIRGNVNAGRQATIPIEIRGRGGLFHSLEAVIDTGFSGHLTLDPETIKLLDLRPMRSVDVILAGNLGRTLNAFRGAVLWHDQMRTVRILEASGMPLLGMRLLAGSQLTLQVRIGGEALIEQMGRRPL